MGGDSFAEVDPVKWIRYKEEAVYACAKYINAVCVEMRQSDSRSLLINISLTSFVFPLMQFPFIHHLRLNAQRNPFRERNKIVLYCAFPRCVPYTGFDVCFCCYRAKHSVVKLIALQVENVFPCV
jgi:hypothetical protein